MYTKVYKKGLPTQNRILYRLAGGTGWYALVSGPNRQGYESEGEGESERKRKREVGREGEGGKKMEAGNGHCRAVEALERPSRPLGFCPPLREDNRERGEGEKWMEGKVARGLSRPSDVRNQPHRFHGSRTPWG